jgi:hypothetical protein
MDGLIFLALKTGSGVNPLAYDCCAGPTFAMSFANAAFTHQSAVMIIYDNSLNIC